VNNPAVMILTESRDKAAAELAAALVVVRDLKANIKAYESAISVLTGAVVVADTQSSGRITLRDMILSRVRDSSGTTSSKVAAELTEGGRQTGETTVSSIFSRLKADGLIERRDGLWFATNKKAPDVSASEAFDDDGPGDGSRVESSQLAPEGSIPFRSTFGTQRLSAFDDDLNDDVPF